MPVTLLPESKEKQALLRRLFEIKKIVMSYINDKYFKNLPRIKAKKNSLLHAFWGRGDEKPIYVLVDEEVGTKTKQLIVHRMKKKGIFAITKTIYKIQKKILQQLLEKSGEFSLKKINSPLSEFKSLKYAQIRLNVDPFLKFSYMALRGLSRYYIISLAKRVKFVAEFKIPIFYASEEIKDFKSILVADPVLKKGFVLPIRNNPEVIETLLQALIQAIDGEDNPTAMNDLRLAIATPELPKAAISPPKLLTEAVGQPSPTAALIELIQSIEIGGEGNPTAMNDLRRAIAVPELLKAAINSPKPVRAVVSQISPTAAYVDLIQSGEIEGDPYIDALMGAIKRGERPTAAAESMIQSLGAVGDSPKQLENSANLSRSRQVVPSCEVLVSA